MTHRPFCVAIFSLAIFIHSYQAIVQAAEEGWDARTVSWASRFDREPPLQLSDGVKATVWAGVKASLHKFHRAQFAISPIFSPDFEKEVPLSVHLAKNDTGETLRRPLIVFLPGIFGGTHAPTVLRAAANFIPRGYHFLAVPNPWSPQYLEAVPKAPIGSELSDALSLLNLIKRHQNRVGEQFISRIEITGESYGGTLGPAALAMDMETEPLISKVTSFGAILHPQATMDVFDRRFGETPRGDLCNCSSLRKYLYLFECVFFSENGSCLTKSHLSAEALLHEVFHEHLIKSSNVLHRQMNKVGKAPRTLTFSEYLDLYTERSLADESELGFSSLSKWIRRMSEAKRRKLRFMTSKDDHLNAEAASDEWDEIHQLLRSGEGPKMARVINLHFGGHVGYLGLPEFQELMDIEYGEFLVEALDPEAEQRRQLNEPLMRVVDPIAEDAIGDTGDGN